ncbi:hypothetical protein CI105_02290 [Candidatus Izimaplasma bacterium ZiA1]|uniref:hypothetical protein n=1 Tax=Candidatus Izimoplasma sp. ZiA1 TaxID=2024899 RepID=UPI000BAA4746|nr:hypothetical protein CI105_02290 [Candidatus Izimaplasma bacterium ZiA1]
MFLDINRQYKMNIILGALFYFGFSLVGIVPFLFYGDGFWEQNILLTIVGAGFGLVFFLSGVSYLYFNIFSFKPRFKLSNIVQGINITLLMFTIDSVIPESNVFTLNVSVWLFVIIGIVLQLSNIIVYYYYKVKSVDVETIIDNTQATNEQSKFNSEVVFLTHYIISGFIVVALLGDFVGVSDYLLVFLFNMYFLYKYNKIVKMNLAVAFISVLLFGMIIFLFVTYNDFINQHIIIKSLLVIVPVVPQLIKVIETYYSIALEESIDNK